MLIFLTTTPIGVLIKPATHASIDPLNATTPNSTIKNANCVAPVPSPKACDDCSNAKMYNPPSTPIVFVSDPATADIGIDNLFVLESLFSDLYTMWLTIPTKILGTNMIIISKSMLYSPKPVPVPSTTAEIPSGVVKHLIKLATPKASPNIALSFMSNIYEPKITGIWISVMPTAPIVIKPSGVSPSTIIIATNNANFVKFSVFIILFLLCYYPFGIVLVFVGFGQAWKPVPTSLFGCYLVRTTARVVPTICWVLSVATDAFYDSFVQQS